MSIVAHGDELAEADRRARRGSRAGVVLYEEFVPGPEVTVNGFAVDGRHHVAAVTARDHFDGAPGVAQRHVFPSGLDDAAAAPDGGRGGRGAGDPLGPDLHPDRAVAGRAAGDGGRGAPGRRP